MADREAEQLRRELGRVTSRQGPCFPREIKERASRWIAEQRAAGATVSEIADALGLASGTVLRWSAGSRIEGKSHRQLVPVEVVHDGFTSRSLSVVSPAGFRIEGVSMAEAAALLKALG